VPNITGARNYVEVAAPAPKVGGLFAVANVIDSTDPHDLLGAEYQTDACTPAEHWSAGNCGYGYPATPCNPTPAVAATLKDFHGLTLVTGDPFTIYDGIDCELLGGPSDYYRGRVEASLRLKEQKAAEQHVAGLLLASTNSLSAGDIVEAVAEAEAWLADNYAGQGVIHMNRKSATLACAAQVVGAGLDGRLATCQGTPVANGAGYGSLVGKVVASGQVTLLRGPITVTNAPGMNVGVECSPPRALAERTYVPLIECGAAIATITPTP
jgi:hypothetical protein